MAPPGTPTLTEWPPPTHGCSSKRGQMGFGARAVLVPVKAFSEAKGRLDTALNDAERAALAAAMADRVLAAAFPLPIVVVCDDNEVAAWARSRARWSSGSRAAASTARWRQASSTWPNAGSSR